MERNYSNRTYMIMPAATFIQDFPKKSRNEASKKNFTNHQAGDFEQLAVKLTMRRLVLSKIVTPKPISLATD